MSINNLVIPPIILLYLRVVAGPNVNIIPCVEIENSVHLYQSIKYTYLKKNKDREKLHK